MAFSSCVLRHRHDHRTGGGGRQLAVGLHLRGDLLRLGEQGFHDLVFRHGLDDLALDENLPLPLPEATPKSLREPRPDR